MGTFLAVPLLYFVLDQDSLTSMSSGDRLTALGILAAGFAIGGAAEALRS